MTEHESRWGRVADDGTVYVRTPAGERAVGSWHAGSPADGLRYYERRYDDLVAEVRLLEHRLADRGDPRRVVEATRRLRESLATARVVGDLRALDARLATLAAAAQARLVRASAERAAQAGQASAARLALVEEAEALAASSDWKRAGDRLRALGDEWRAVRGGDRREEAALSRRLTAARETFGRRRAEHFATRDAERAAAAERKRALAAEAEELAASTDWREASARFQALLAAWKAAGPAPRPVEDELWERFRAARESFFERRSAAFAARDAELRGNVADREALLAEAEAIDVEADVEAARRRLREIEERWDAAGRVPREVAAALDRRMAAVADRVRGAAAADWRRADSAESPLALGLRESIAKLTAQARRARAEGRAADADRIEDKLATQREWLARAERG